MDLDEIGINAGNWADSTQDRNYWRALVNATLKLHKSWSSLVNSSFNNNLRKHY